MNIIRKIREKDLEITQTEFANICDVGIQTVFDLEHSTRKDINDKVLQTLERLNYDVNDIKQSYDYQRQQTREEKLQELA